MERSFVGEGVSSSRVERSFVDAMGASEQTACDTGSGSEMTPSTRRAKWRDARLDDLVVWWCEDLPRVDGRLRFAFYALSLIHI